MQLSYVGIDCRASDQEKVPVLRPAAKHSSKIHVYAAAFRLPCGSMTNFFGTPESNSAYPLGA
ncbi:hypothetical protein AWB78_06140 [Caballeronia calidae]|uniref:Uncharacterized protein n=1 Tax=Caballeronia calidae TaxID=1777139 RepID=A0A158E3J5_9BURK|nr:hypothetical protein AWB78_06140 [Caballeronia calidae]